MPLIMIIANNYRLFIVPNSVFSALQTLFVLSSPPPPSNCANIILVPQRRSTRVREVKTKSYKPRKRGR